MGLISVRMRFLKFSKHHTLMANQERSEEDLLAITEVQRLELADKAREVFEDQADILMAHLPMGGAEKVATKDDLANMKNEILGKMYQQTVITITAITGLVGVMLALSKWG